MTSNLPACSCEHDGPARSYRVTYVLDLRAGKAGKSIRTIRGGNESSLAEIVLGLEVSHLGFVGSVHNSYRDGEDSVALDWSVNSPIVPCGIHKPLPVRE